MDSFSSLPAPIRRAVGTRGLDVNSVGRSGAQVFHTGGMYLKTDSAGRLERAARMHVFFAGLGLSVAPVEYLQENGRDWLLLPEMPGRSAIDPLLLARPEALAARIGEAVRRLHEQPAAGCPFWDVNEQALAAYERDCGQPFPEPADALLRDAVTHGDCCLPNLFFGETDFKGFIDLTDAGVGDRHFDLCWAIWSLEYNAKSARFSARFLDAYGRDAVDEYRLALCTRIARCGQ